MLLLRFTLSNGDIVYKFHAFIPTQDKTGYKECVIRLIKVPRKRLSPKMITKTFMSFNTVIYKESLANRINYLCELPGVEVIIKR
jgi:hypothetical protein